MKTTIKLLMVTVMFCTLVFAEDGNQGSGNNNCQNGGCRSASTTVKTDVVDTTDIVIATIRQILGMRF